MSNFDFSAQLQDIVTENLKEEVNEILNNDSIKTQGQLILSLCQVFRNKVEIKTREFLAFGKYKTTLYSHRLLDTQSQISDEELMVYGAQLIYALRTYFNSGEEILYHFGSKDSNGRYLSDAFVSQSQVLQSLSQVTKKSIGVSLAIQRDLIEQNFSQDVVFSNQWKLVESLAEPSADSENSNKVQVGVSKKTKKAIWAYQNQKKDTQVYISYRGKSIVKYYQIGKSMIYFNNGWLWEWYDSIYHSGDELKNTEVANSLRQGSIAPIILEKDNTPGTKQGDYKNFAGQQVQNKYNNAKIISFNNILKIITEFTTALEAMLTESNSVEAQNKFLSILKENFIPQTVEKESQDLNEKIDTDLLSLLYQKK